LPSPFLLPTLGELLSDPMVQALMAADRVPPDELEADLSKIARTLHQHRARQHQKGRSAERL
jgi:hypothetical protein